MNRSHNFSQHALHRQHRRVLRTLIHVLLPPSEEVAVLHLPRLGPFRLKFCLGRRKHFCSVAYPCRGSRHQRAVGVWDCMEVSHVVGSHFYTSRYRGNGSLLKSNICWGVGVRRMEEGLFWASVEQMPRMPGGDQLPLQIRALNYKVFTNANSWGKSSALICVMVSVTGD